MAPRSASRPPSASCSLAASCRAIHFAVSRREPRVATPVYEIARLGVTTALTKPSLKLPLGQVIRRSLTCTTHSGVVAVSTRVIASVLRRGSAWANAPGGTVGRPGSVRTSAAFAPVGRSRHGTGAQLLESPSIRRHSELRPCGGEPYAAHWRIARIGQRDDPIGPPSGAPPRGNRAVAQRPARRDLGASMEPLPLRAPG
jgi:hypothetical protein